MFLILDLGLLLLAFGLRVVSSYSHYQTMIPNGHRVPDPCEDGAVWNGVGHKIAIGGGARNPFGVHFARNDHVSASLLCHVTFF